MVWQYISGNSSSEKAFELFKKGGPEFFGRICEVIELSLSVGYDENVVNGLELIQCALEVGDMFLDEETGEANQVMCFISSLPNTGVFERLLYHKDERLRTKCEKIVRNWFEVDQ